MPRVEVLTEVPGRDPETLLTNRQGRPMPLVPTGAVVPELLA